MIVPKWIKPFFIVSAVYDFLLGVGFLFGSSKLFTLANVVPPNHIGYVQFPAAFLIIFGLMLFNVAKDPMANKNLIFYAILVKFAYCAIVFSHWFANNIPFMWVPFAICDLIFMLLFIKAQCVIKECIK